MFVPKPANGQVRVVWLQAEDGHRYGQEFHDSTEACQAGLLSQALQVGLLGHVAKQPENGHPLRGKYAGLYEMKPGDYRFIGFRDGGEFYITNGAHKDEDQDSDFRLALKLWNEFKDRKARIGGKAKSARKSNGGRPKKR